MFSRQLLKLLKPQNVSSPRTVAISLSKRGMLQPYCLNLKLCHLRHLSTSFCALRQTVAADNIINSHLPDLVIPKDVPFHDYFFNICDKHRDNVALEEFMTGSTCTYGQLKSSVISVASGLHRQGFRKGDVVLVFSTNCIDFTILMLACSKLGLWFSPANPTFTAEELHHQITHAGAGAVFAAAAMSDTVTKALSVDPIPNISHKYVFGDAPGFSSFQSLKGDDGTALPNVFISPQEDVLTLPYSSGTTGLPKGVMLTHYNCLANVLQTSESVAVKERDVSLGLLPLYHIYGLIVVQFGVLKSGGKIVFLPKFEPDTMLKCIQEKKITVAHLVPPLIVFLTKHPMCSQYDLSSIKTVVCGAAPLGADVTAEFLNRYPNIEFCGQGYGLTETSPVTNIDTTQTKGSIGNMVVNTLGKIIDLETSEVLGPNELGEYCVKGPQVMKGYFQNKAATDDMIASDGWMSTGDIGYFDEEGKFYIKDRLKELIKYKGSQVPPAELEALLLSHPDIQDVAVIGKPDEIAGELPLAFVVRKPESNITQEDIVKFVEDRVAPVKRLRGGVQFIEVIPKNPSGKILRRILRAEYL